MKQNMQDLTEGPLGKKILIFSVPLMLSNLLQVLFNMADIAVIGQFAGSLSLGAVGSTATLVTMFTGFLIGLSGGIEEGKNHTGNTNRNHFQSSIVKQAKSGDSC
jgi:Na+-driven multidrug efflux pump